MCILTTLLCGQGQRAPTKKVDDLMFENRTVYRDDNQSGTFLLLLSTVTTSYLTNARLADFTSGNIYFIVRTDIQYSMCPAESHGSLKGKRFEISILGRLYGGISHRRYSAAHLLLRRIRRSRFPPEGVWVFDGDKAPTEVARASPMRSLPPTCPCTPLRTPTT